MNTENDSAVKLTVFTPTYNRKSTLERTFKSLTEQSCKEFIWLIIDDGSTDGTGDTVELWKKQETGFEIRYVYKKNGGMHTAHNEAYRYIDTELNVCIDSDDLMVPAAVEKILSKWETVCYADNIAGIIALDADLEGKVIGKGFPKGLTETTVCGYYANGGKGDKKLIYRTDIIKKYPEYPVFEGEKYVSLSYKYRLIDQKYQMAVLDEVVCNVDYQPDGSSNSMMRQYIHNPKGFFFWRQFCLKYPSDDSIIRQFINCIHYVSSAVLSNNRHFLRESPRKFMTVAAIPFGLILTGYIRAKAGED